MSTVYNLEPPPTAKAVLHTTMGELELEIFAKQAPRAARNFLQHCVDGYYDGSIFHRLVPGFILQGGDPTGTGDGGEAIYEGGTFEDEIHSRLKFNRRGLLGMANGGKRDDNGSQFFLTLAKADELTGRHTMFGRIAGDTIYNLMKMADAELSDDPGSERPMYPVRITHTEVLLNPFEDMVARTARATAPAHDEERVEKVSKAKKRKGGKALLSFGGDDEGDVSKDVPMIKKAKFNPKVVAARPDEEEQDDHGKDESPSQPKKGKRRSPSPGRRAAQQPYHPPPPPKSNHHPERQLPLRDEESPSRSPTSSPEAEQVERVSSLLDRTNAQIQELKASMKRNVETGKDTHVKPKSALEQMVPATAIRGRKRKQNSARDEAATIKALDAFQAKLDAAPVASRKDDGTDDAIDKEAAVEDASTGEGEAVLCDLHFIAGCQSCAAWDKQPEDEAADEADSGWMSHALSFAKDRLGKDLTWKKKNEEELVVIDPREKAKEIAAAEKAKRAARQNHTQVRNIGREAGRAR